MQFCVLRYILDREEHNSYSGSLEQHVHPLSKVLKGTT